MPAQRPRAAFEPIAPDLDLKRLVENTPSFTWVDRISADLIDQQGIAEFDRLVLLHVVIGGKPLIVDGYQTRLDPWTFSPKWLQDNHGEKVEKARNLGDQGILPLTITHYLKNMSLLTNQYFENAQNYKDKRRQRVYLNDIDCPPVWVDKLRECLPPNLFYLNDNTGELGGPGAVFENAPTGGKRKGKGIATAGDLMSSLPASMRADNMMCYVGHEGTYTPAHREMCASLGHNIMVETSELVGDNGRPEKPGSSIWFMTESKDRHLVSEYWLSILGHDIEVERHFAQVAAWKRAPFTTYICEQRAGDLILIPPLAPHQVWNRGTRTMKAAWNRTTTETLEMAINEALPNSRVVCRDEQYKNKAIIYFTLDKYSGLLARAKDLQQTAPTPEEAHTLRTHKKIKDIRRDFKKLFRLFKDILVSEMFNPDAPERSVQFLPYESFVTCAYCRCNIFNRFLTCNNCDDLLHTTEPEPYDVCMDCYAMGRSCGCVSKLKWTEQFKWKELVQKYEHWRSQFFELQRDRKSGDPLPLSEEYAQLGKKTLAQVCQEQLKKRPFTDVHKKKNQLDEASEEEDIVVNDDGTVKKFKKRRSEAWLKSHHACHVCCHRHEKWKMAACECGRHWCYGVLFRGFDLMPRQVMEMNPWKCPHCLSMCSAGACRKDPRQTSYRPKGTLLGHDTRRVADERSVESLVDFSVSNLNWLKETVDAPVDNERLQQRMQEAHLAKQQDPFAAEYDDDADPASNSIHYDPDPTLDGQGVPDTGVIDPFLMGEDVTVTGIRPATSNTMDVSAVLNGSQPPEDLSYSGYQAAQGFVAPTDLYHRPPAQDENDSDSIYPELIGDSGKKRKRASDDIGQIKLIASSKRNKKQVVTQDRVELTGAGKQYQKEQQKKQLEEARRTGRYIMAQAALKGRSKIVKMSLNPAHLRRFLALEVEKRKVAAAGSSIQVPEKENFPVLVRSDVIPIANMAQAKPAGKESSNKDKASRAVKIRVEHDDEFSTRNRSGNKGKTPNKNPGRDVELLDLDSDEELGASDSASENENEHEPKRSRRANRVSAWQAKRHGKENDNLPDELPNDWKEGRRGKGRTRESDGVQNEQQGLPLRKRKPAGKSIPQIHPLGMRQPIQISDESGDESNAGSEVAEAQDEPTGAQQEQNANRRAKLEAAGFGSPAAAGKESGNHVPQNGKDLADQASGGNKDTVPTASAVRKPGTADGSILAKRGPGGRKIKIVSGAAARRSMG